MRKIYISLLFLALAFAAGHAEARMSSEEFFTKGDAIYEDCEKYLLLKTESEQTAALKKIFENVASMQKENQTFYGLGKLEAVKQKNEKLFQAEVEKRGKKFVSYIEQAFDVTAAEQEDADRIEKEESSSRKPIKKTKKEDKR